MTHNENRTHWFKEGVIGLGVGVLYGVTNVCVGHPFDTIKTKMQAQAGFEKGGMFKTFVKTVKYDGVRGLYRGCIPPLWGSGIFRSAQFAVFEAVYTYMDGDVSKAEIPLTGGLQIRVLCGAVVASTVRAIIECPLEYAKGFGLTWTRTIGLMTTYFILIDSSRRHFSNEFKQSFVGPFLASGFSATIGWWVVWPLEYMKSQVQGSYGKNQPLWIRMKTVMKERGGFFGLYRGLAPGSIRSFLANGVSMIVMANAQKKITDWGLRN